MSMSTLDRQSLGQFTAKLKRPELQGVADWYHKARPNQLPPEGDWLTWLILAGRGFGKTRAGAEWALLMAALYPNSRGACIAPTFGDVRDTCFEGVSGILACAPPGVIADYNSGLSLIKFTNGAQLKGFSADIPNRLRGPQHHWAWGDEVSSWRYMDTLDQVFFGLRLGDHPKLCVTTTPKPNPITRRLITSASTVTTRGSTFDNAANLSAVALAELREKYEGTRLGRQELYAEFLDDILGALWTRQTIEHAKKLTARPAMKRIVVSVDPSGSDGETGDLQGIIVAGLGTDNRGYILGDYSLQGSPDEWAEQVVKVYDAWKADMVVAERNYGGEMVKYTMQTKRKNLPVTLITASRGKHVRAEPVAALYEQGKVSHLDHFPELEDQMAMMTSEGYVGMGSPDRVDALVWALTALMLGQKTATVTKMKMG